MEGIWVNEFQSSPERKARNGNMPQSPEFKTLINITDNVNQKLDNFSNQLRLYKPKKAPSYKC
jgi:hypothetical protein